MPKFLENILKKEDADKGFSGEKADRYVYGAMNNMGAMHGNKETPKGAAMQEKHESDQAKGKTGLRRLRVRRRRPRMDGYNDA